VNGDATPPHRPVADIAFREATEVASNRFYQRHGFVLVEQGEFDNHYVRHANAAG